jgi:hypothetical protein
MAAAETARLIASLELKDNMSKGLNSANAGVGKLEGKLSNLGNAAKRGVGQAAATIKTLGVVGAVAAVGIIAKSVTLASDLAETTSKVGVVFGEATDEVLAFGETSAAAIGLSKNAALGAVATYGNLFVSMGLGTDQAADMSTKLVTLAGDLASFNNIDPTEAADKLRAGLTGEAEPLKSLGININETIIKAKALELGLVKTGQSTADLRLKTVAMNKAQKEAAAATKKYGANSTQALTATVKAEKAQAALEKTTKTFPGTLDAATKAQAAYALIFEQSATAQGDFGRTSEGLANQQRILKANLDNLGATLGTALLPSVAKLVSKFNELAVKSTPAIKELGAALPGILDAGIAFVEGIPWDQVANGLQMAGTFAKGLFQIFTSLPPEVQGTIVALAALNKLSGGAVGGIVSELGKGLIKGVLGMNAGVVNLNAATVSGLGGAGGAAAAAGKGGLGLISKVFLVGEAIGLAALVLQVKNGISDSNTAFAKTLAQQNQEWLSQNPTLPALEAGLAAVERGILDIARTDPQGLVSGESLAELRAIHAAILVQINNQKKGKVGPEVFGPKAPAKAGGLSPGERGEQLVAIMARAKAAGRTPNDPVAAAQATLGRNQLREQEKTKAAVDAVRTQEARTTAAVLVAAAAIQGIDRQQPVPQVSTFTTVNVTAGGIEKKVVVQRRFGPPGGSRHKGGGPQEFD